MRSRTMTRARWAVPALLVWVMIGVGPGAGRALAKGDAWAGTWVTDEGALTLQQDKRSVKGTYGRGGSVEGEVHGTKVEGTYRLQGVEGRIEWEMEKGGHAFKGTWTEPQGSSGAWRGWKPDEDAKTKPNADFAGTWLTSIGMFRLEKKGAGVEGPWGQAARATIQGKAKGRRLEAHLAKPTWQGDVWIEMTPDGKRIFGLTDENPPAAVIGLSVDDFDPSPKLEAGKIAQGVTGNGMLYFARPPTGWKRGKPVDAIVLLHGSNWTTKGMVWVTAKNWPELAKRYMIVGIQGDQWASWSEADDLRFNYDYVNWMGKSTYEGYPYTDRASPTFVADAITELGKELDWGRVFLGGHSQGGFMSYLLLMHYPERLAGVFAVSGGLVIQAEPDAFEDQKLRAAQRATPLAIVHGTKDNVVPFDTALYIRDRFEGAGFPLTTLISPGLGHPYDFLPIDDAIGFLDAMSTTDADALAAYANEAAERGRWHDVGAALARAKTIGADAKLAAAARRYDAEASKQAEHFLERWKKGEGGAWVDEFYAWKLAFGGAPAAAEVLAAYRKREHVEGPKADQLFVAAQKAFRSGDRDAGRAKYDEILDRCFASGLYPIVKRWVADMK